MKVVFLDIDGVLNSRRTAVAFGHYGYIGSIDGYWLDPIAIKLVEKLCDLADAKVVISSSWRIGAEMDEMKRVFEDYKFHIIDFTPRIYDIGSIRGDEIEAWLGEHPGVTHYVILDDDSDMHEHHKQDHFVHVNMDQGFSIHDFEKACQILDVPTKEFS